MLGLAAAITEAIMSGPEGGGVASLTMAGLDPRDPNKIYDGFKERAIQWWPESISDSIEIGWGFKDMPGASNALAQWASNGGRTISFEVQLSRFIRPVNERAAIDKYISLQVRPDSQNPRDLRGSNVDIAEQIRWLRAFCYPTYEGVDGIVAAYPPPIMILNVPNFQLNESGGDAIFAVMTGCDVSYALAFPDGTPRRATVSLTLRQVVQMGNAVRFKGFGANAPAQYSFGGDEMDNRNAGRSLSGIKVNSVK